MLSTAVLPTTVSLASEREQAHDVNTVDEEVISELSFSDPVENLVSDNNLSVINDGFTNDQVDFDKFDEFVSVENNQYILTLPSDHSFTENEISTVEKQLLFSNRLVFENQVALDAETEEAIISIPDGSMTRGIGSTYVKIYWNYINVGIARHVLRGGITAGASAIAGSIAAYYTMGAASTFVARVVGGMVGAYAANKIHSGIWFHLNYAYGINNYGWQ